MDRSFRTPRGAETPVNALRLGTTWREVQGVPDPTGSAEALDTEFVGHDPEKMWSTQPGEFALGRYVI